MRKINRYIPTGRSREMNIERVEEAWDEKFRINKCNYLRRCFEIPWIWVGLIALCKSFNRVTFQVECS